MVRESAGPSELEHAGRPQDPVGFAGDEFVADLALAAGGFGVAVTLATGNAGLAQRAHSELSLLIEVQWFWDDLKDGLMG